MRHINLLLTLILALSAFWSLIALFVCVWLQDITRDEEHVNGQHDDGQHG